MQARQVFNAGQIHQVLGKERIISLTSITGFSEVLFDETFGPLTDKQKKYVNNVLTSGKHLLLLINDLLDMAKVEAGRMHLSLSITSMKSLLQEISLMVEDMVRTKNLEPVSEIVDDLPDIEADELKVNGILYNLLSNEVKFTWKATRRIPGIGIAPENMDEIFEGFF